MRMNAPQASSKRTQVKTVTANSRIQGFTLIEILVTLAIVLIGILGIFGLQTKAMSVEFESYQRGQALSLARDMEARMSASRGLIASYLIPDVLSSTDGSKYVGISGTVDCVSAGDFAKAQTCAWGESLKGAAVKEGSNKVGAMIGARGCLIRIEPPQSNSLADLYIVVVWQGVVAGSEPPVDAIAGQSNCANDVNFGTGLRRGVSLRVMVPDLKKTT